MHRFSLKVIFDQAYYRALVRPDQRADISLTLNGQHAGLGAWGDRRLDGLACKLDLLCAARVDSWDKGGWFTKQLRSEWVAAHGEAACLGRLLIRKNLSPAVDETYGPIGVPLEIALMLSEEDVREIISQIRFRQTCGSKTSIDLTVGSNILPKRFTHAGDLDVSGDVEYPIVESLIQDFPD